MLEMTARLKGKNEPNINTIETCTFASQKEGKQTIKGKLKL